MKRKLTTLLIAVLYLPLTAMANDIDCFPLCAEPLKDETKIELIVDTKIEAAIVVAPREAAAITPKLCESGLVKQVEELNDKIKPIKEIIGYVRSPQGLAIKLVNDHIVKIPPWVGYAMDPIGSVKRRVIDEVRTRAKQALFPATACVAEPAANSATTVDAVDAKHTT